METQPGLPLKSFRWVIVLLVLGTMLTVFTLAVIFAPPSLVLRTVGLSLSPWGPICLIIGALMARHVSKVNRLARFGITARATVQSIDSTGANINGRQVLRIGMSVAVDELPEYPVTVRNAPPYHLVGMLRPGASIPVVVDPDTPEQVLIDWKRAEREPSGPGL